MLEQPSDAALDVGAPKLARLERHGDRLADRAARIERGARILEDHLDGPLRLAPRRGVAEIASLEQDRARARRRRARGSCGRSSICRSRFRPARPKTSPLDESEADVVDRLHFARARPSSPPRTAKGLAEADDFEQRLAQAAASSRRQQAALWPGADRALVGRAVAHRDRQRAARREAAAGRRRGIVGQRPVDALEGRLPPDSLGTQSNQRARIGVARPGENPARRTAARRSRRRT